VGKSVVSRLRAVFAFAVLLAVCVSAPVLAAATSSPTAQVSSIEGTRVAVASAQIAADAPPAGGEGPTGEEASAGIAVAADSEDEAQATLGPRDVAPSSDVVKEIPELRTATSRTYELPDGSREARVFQAPINFRDDDGLWKAIDVDLREAEGGAGLVNGGADFDLRLPSSMGEGAVQLARDGQWVSYRLLNLTAPLTAAKNSNARYEARDGGVALDLTSTATGVKEEIQLDSASAPSTFAFDLKASQGLTAELAPDGSVRFSDQEGHPFAVLPPPTIADSSGATPGRPGDHISYSLAEGEAGAWRLVVTADREWIEDPERVSPVRIDPTVTLTNSNMDCTIYSLPAPGGWSACGNSGVASLVSGYNQKEGNAARTLVSFPAVGVVPAGGSIYDATVSLYSPKEAENTQTLEMYGLTKFWYYASVDWDSLAGPWLWSTPGGDYAPATKAEVKTSERGSAPGWWNFRSDGLTEQVTKWNGELSYGVVVKQSIENKSECEANPAKCNRRHVEFQSSSSAPTGNRPKLVIKYWENSPKTSKVISPTDGTRTAKRLKLQATWNSGVTGVTWQYREGKAGLFKDVPAELVRDGEGKAVTKWPVAAPESKTSDPLYLDAPQLSPTLRKKGGSVQIRALFEGGEPGVSAPVEAKLDPALGGPKDATAQVGPGSVDLLTGNFTVTKTDVSIPTFNSSLDFSRTFNSRDAGKLGDTGVLGQGWKPGVPVEENGAGEWRSVKIVNDSEVIEGVSYPFSYAMVTGIEGVEIPFEKEEGGSAYKTPDELAGWSLTAPNANQFVLSTPNGTKTTFDNTGSGSEYLPIVISRPGASTNSIRMTYAVVGGNRRLSMVIAPSPSSSCAEEEDITSEGCKGLEFTYAAATTWGAPSGYGDRLSKITYYAAGGAWDVARYGYNAQGRLIEVWDPRVSPSLKETYAYESTGQIATITPPGLKPWTMEYGTLNEEEASGRLMAVKRDSLVAGEAQTTIAYGVSLETPYKMTAGEVAKWGQTDLPVDATAILPPDPSTPPSSYSRASVYYMDSDGYSVNTVTPAGAGTEKASISTTETDKYGNVIRELTPQNRIRALDDPKGETVLRSKELATTRLYEDDGTEMVEQKGPLHDVRLEGTGEVVPARSYSFIKYDEVPAGVTLPTPAPHLPTTEMTAALHEGVLKDARTNKTEYNWTLRKPTKTIVDAGEGGLEIASVTAYDKDTGLPVEVRQPSNEGGGGAGTTKTIYYTQAGGNGCAASKIYAGLPCKVEPAALLGGSGQPPKLLVKQFAKYNALSQPTEVIERPGGEGATRKTIATYDAAGRRLTATVEGGGVAAPKVETLYDESTGQPTTQRFVCESECEGGPPSYRFAFGATGSGNGQFKYPAGIAIDSAGDLWVVDKTNRRVQKFNAKGEYLASFGSQGAGDGQFGRPTDIAIDSKGNLWVTDASNSRIEKFAPNGEFIAKYGTWGTGNGQFNEPESIAVDAKGFIWVGDTHNGRLQKFTDSGEFLKVVGSKGSGPGQFYSVTGLDVGPNGDLWAGDWGNNRVTVFDEAGKFVRQFGSSGSGNGQFSRPDAIEVDDQGNVWVGDEGNARIQQFNQKGEYVAQFGAKGSGPGEFSFGWPMGIATDSKGAIWVSDTFNDRVHKWKNGFDDQEVSTTYDALGRPTSYRDADGNLSTVTYDLLGRPVTTNDGRGAQTRTYDPDSGLLTELEDSAAGTFTAGYDSDGNLIAEGLPNGLVAESTYDEAGQLTDLAYNKAGSAWLDFDAERSINGQILRQQSLQSTQEYSYDKAGRLTLTKDTPQGGVCTTRAYGFEGPAGKNSNRTKLITRVAGIGSACNTESGGTTQNYEYDAADRLIGGGIVYDDFGRVTSLPASYAGGKTLTSSYFSTDMVASQTQNGVTNTFQLDAALRQSRRVQGGGFEGTEVFHYADGSDAPAWKQLGGKWSRNIPGIGGNLAAIQDSSSGTLLQLTNVHGDVVATASLSPSATEPVATFEYDEFGVPKQGGTPQFGWLGGKGRRTEFSSGVIQMGARSYVPSLGRFLTPDPILGGSANAYDYANQDPVNAFDLDGNCSTKKNCAKALNKAKANVRKAIAGIKALARQKRAESTRRLPGLEGVHFPRLPWEDDLNDAVKKATNALIYIDEATSCTNSGVVVAGTGYLLEKKGAGLFAQAGPRIAAGVTKLGSRLTGVGVLLGVMGALHLC
jgi:RHS repeat-associated protein